MINWISLCFNALWIVGLGLEVSALSFAYFLAGERNTDFRKALDLPACQMVVDIGMVFFCLGIFGSITVIWERIVWAALALIFAIKTWRDRKKIIA
jgi:hypothetical protein